MTEQIEGYAESTPAYPLNPYDIVAIGLSMVSSMVHAVGATFQVLGNEFMAAGKYARLQKRQREFDSQFREMTFPKSTFIVGLEEGDEG